MKPIRRIAVADLRRRVAGPALPQRELGQASPGPGRRTGCPRRARRATPAGAGARRPRRTGRATSPGGRSSSCVEDLVDPERPDVLRPPEGALALVPAAEPVQVVGLAAQQVRPEEPHQAEPLRHRDAHLRHLDAPPRAGRPSRAPTPVGVRPADVVDDVGLLRDRERGGAGPRGPVDVAADRRGPRRSVLSAWPSMSRAPTARARTNASSASGRDSAKLPAEHQDLRPARRRPAREPRTADRPGSGPSPSGTPRWPGRPGRRSTRSARAAH